jgi:hypothetical protein
MLVKDLPVTSDVDILDPLGIDPFQASALREKKQPDTTS